MHLPASDIAVYTWFWPVIGCMIGVFVGVVGYFSRFLFHPLLSAAITYAFTLWFTGFHHLDGLIDVGDAMMVHSTPEKRIEVMRDLKVGVGGISLFFLIGIMTILSIYPIPFSKIFQCLVVSEMSAKLGIVSCCTISRPYINGTGRHFIKNMNARKFFLSITLTILIAFAILRYTGILGVVGGIIAGIVVGIYSRIYFRWATGDVLGASNEIARMVSLMFMNLEGLT